MARPAREWRAPGPVLDAGVISDEGGRGERASFTGAPLSSVIVGPSVRRSSRFSPSSSGLSRRSTPLRRHNRLEWRGDAWRSSPGKIAQGVRGWILGTSPRMTGLGWFVLGTTHASSFTRLKRPVGAFLSGSDRTLSEAKRKIRTCFLALVQTLRFALRAQRAV